MRIPFLLVGVLLMHLGSISSAGPHSLEGCPEPRDTGAALATLHERGWPLWAPQELAKVWPRTLTPLECQLTRGTCVLLGHKGRSSEDACECCETFQFDQEDRDGKGQRLSAVIVYYSAEEYADVLSAARLLAKTMGLPESEGPAGQDQPPPQPLRQSFEWKEAGLQKRAVMDLEISHRKVWTVYLRVGWHPEG